MDTLDARIEHGLHEVRIVMLGTQVLLGFAFMFPFLPGFDALPSTSRYLGVGSLCLLLLTIGFLLLPSSYHRLVEEGVNSESFQEVITRSLEVALLPFALSLGIDMYIPAEKIVGFPAGLAFGMFGALLALVFWYGVEASGKDKNVPSRNDRAERRRSRRSEESQTTSEVPSLEERIKQVLLEVRIVLPGLQAVLGFQFITAFQQSFDRLPASLQLLHLISLGLVAVSIILLMSPAAYHRIVGEGQDSERLHRYSGVVLIIAMTLLALGFAGDLFVVTQKVAGSTAISLGAACLIILVFYGLWFGYTVYVRNRGIRANRPSA